MALFFGTRKHPKPSYGAARWLRFDYSGNVFELKVPPNTEHDLSSVIGAPYRNIYDMNNFLPPDESFVNAPRVYDGGHRENWTYRGLPFIDGCLGRMSIYMPLVYNNCFGNLFRPSGLESFLAMNLDRLFGPNSSSGGASRGGCVAPLNWQVITINHHTWVHYEVESPHNKTFFSVWNTPISASHILEVGFDSTEENPHKYCRAAFLETINQIVSTFKITLSEASLQEKREAEQQWPNAQYSATMPEKPWSIANREAYVAKGMM